MIGKQPWSIHIPDCVRIPIRARDPQTTNILYMSQIQGSATDNTHRLLTVLIDAAVPVKSADSLKINLPVEKQTAVIGQDKISGD